MAEDSRTGADLENPAFLAGDRSDTYRWMRDEAPAYAVGPRERRVWMVSRHADVQRLLRNPEGRAQPIGTDAPPWLKPGPALRRLQGNMAQTDGGLHTRLRGVVAPLFTARQSELLRAAAAAEVSTDLSRVVEQGGSFDAVAELGALVPRGVLRLLIGMPDEDWQMAIARQVDFLLIFSSFPLNQEQLDRLDEVAQFYFDYFEDLLGRTKHPTPLVERLLRAEEDGDLSHDEVLSLMHTVLSAGNETTRTTIANTVQVLAEHPALFAAAKADPHLIPNMTEELIRARPPIHLLPRTITDVFVTSDGTEIPAGAFVLAVIGAANSDERVFADPATIDPHRSNAAKHVGFGGGLHHCLGAPIARIQVQEVVRELTTRFAGLHLDEPNTITRNPHLIFPSLTALPVTAVG